MEHFLTRVNPKIIFADYDNIKQIKNVVKRMELPINIQVFDTVFLDNDRTQVLDILFNSFIIDTDSRFFCAKHVRDTAIILLSCGTTGFLRDVEVPYTIFLDSNQHVPVMRWGDVGLWFESLSWIFNLILTVRAIFMNVTVIVSSGFKDEHHLCQIIKNYKVS